MPLLAHRAFQTGMLLLLVLTTLWTGCGDSDASSNAASDDAGQARIVTTIEPLGMILWELTRGRRSVEILLDPGSSPHTYEPTPSAVRAINGSVMLVHAHEHLDGWVTSLPASRSLELAPLIPPANRISMPSPDPERQAGHVQSPSHDDTHDGLDPHFWASPAVVQSMIPALVDSLCAADADGCSTYRKNGDAFITDLEAIHRRIASMLRPVKGTPVMLAQPFFQYFLTEYDIPVVGVVEPHPGKEPSPQQIRALIRTVEEKKPAVIFTQRQLPGRSARVIARETEIPTVDLDPMGGTTGQTTYREFLMHNAREVFRALGPAEAMDRRGEGTAVPSGGPSG